MANASRKTNKKFSERILELETLYTQKELAKKLGVSPGTLRSYRQGKTQPRNEKIFEKVNRTYYNNKTKIIPEAVERKREYFEKKFNSEIKIRYASIFPNYMEALRKFKYEPPLNFYNGTGTALKILHELHDRGYVAAWKGPKEIPLEVEFVAGGYGSDLNTTGKHPQLLTIYRFGTSDPQSPAEYADYIFTFDYFVLSIGGFKRGNTKQKHDAARSHIFNHPPTKSRNIKGELLAYMGYWFEEGDGE